VFKEFLRIYFSRNWKRCRIERHDDNVRVLFYFKNGKVVEVNITYKDWQEFLKLLGLEKIIEVV